MLTNAQIAQVCHDANRALQIVLGDDNVSPPWDDAPDWQTESAYNGVALARSEDVTDEQLHTSWSAEKQADGWVYGPEKNEARKTHPCLVPYSALPAGQRAKDALFRAVVDALKAVEL